MISDAKLVGDWPEDFSGENGNYFNTCCHCGRQFRGYKRRVTCKVCAAPLVQSEILEEPDTYPHYEESGKIHQEWIDYTASLLSLVKQMKEQLNTEKRYSESLINIGEGWKQRAEQAEKRMKGREALLKLMNDA